MRSPERFWFKNQRAESGGMGAVVGERNHSKKEGVQQGPLGGSLLKKSWKQPINGGKRIRPGARNLSERSNTLEKDSA